MFKKASTITVPDIMFRTIRTGVPQLDKAFSDLGGLVPSQVVLLTGKPGAGKTTLALLAAACLTRRVKRPGAFVSLEMSDFQLALSSKKIPGFGELMVETDWHGQQTLQELRDLHPSCIVLDSLQKASGLQVLRKQSSSFNQGQKDVVNALYAFAKETYIPIFIIGHCTKGGSYLGPSHLEHEVDSHMEVDHDRENQLRTFSFGKNRFGGDSDPVIFGITSSNVWVGNPYAGKSKSGAPQLSGAQPLAQAITRFKQDNRDRKKLPAPDVRVIATLVIDHLRELDGDRIRKDSAIGDPSKVHLVFDYSGVADCNSTKGRIRIGDKVHGETFKLGSIGYAREQSFILKHCSTREDLFLWVMVHEWCHLHRGMQHHRLEFFRNVEQLYLRLMASLG